MAEKKPSKKSSCISRIAAAILIIVNLITIDTTEVIAIALYERQIREYLTLWTITEDYINRSLTIFQACCSVLIAFSLWAIASPTTLSTAIQAFGGKTLTALLPPSSVSVSSAGATVAVATFTCCVACMGVYGAVCPQQFMLFMYSTLVLLLLLLECALMFYFTSNLIEKGIQIEDGQWAHYTRLVFQCCDFNSSQYRDAAVPPWSCCGTDFYPVNCTVPDSFPKDCKPTISNWLDRYGTMVYTSLAVFHVILTLCSLIRRRSSASRSHS